MAQGCSPSCCISCADEVGDCPAGAGTGLRLWQGRPADDAESEPPCKVPRVVRAEEEEEDRRPELPRPRPSAEASPLHLLGLPLDVLQSVLDFKETFEIRARIQMACAGLRLVDWRLAPVLSLPATLTGMGLGDAGARSVAETLMRMEGSGSAESYFRLHLGRNKIGDEGAAVIASALLVAKVLRRVILDDNAIGDRGASALMAAARSCPQLKELNLCRNRLSSAARQELRQLPRTRTTGAAGGPLSVLLDWDPPEPTYMAEKQQDINGAMRFILFDWLVDVQYCQGSSKVVNGQEWPCSSVDLDDLFRAFSFVDRFLARRAVPRSRLQLVGVACMLLAAQWFEQAGADGQDRRRRAAEWLAAMTDDAYTPDEVLSMTGEVCEALDGELHMPTAHTMLIRYLTVAGWQDMSLKFGTYLLLLSSTTYEMLRYSQEAIAVAAVTLAHRVLGESSGTTPGRLGVLLRMSGVAPQELAECVGAMAALHERAPYVLSSGRVALTVSPESSHAETRLVVEEAVTSSPEGHRGRRLNPGAVVRATGAPVVVEGHELLPLAPDCTVELARTKPCRSPSDFANVTSPFKRYSTCEELRVALLLIPQEPERQMDP